MRQFPTILVPMEPTSSHNYTAVLNALSCPYFITQKDIPVDSFDLLLLPGGGDIYPYLYADANLGSRKINLEQDLVQFSLLDRFVHQKKPVLGICKGLQIIQIYFGGSLIQNLSCNLIHQLPKGDCYHLVENQTGSIPYSIYGTQCIVNSSHHQAIITPAPHLQITQMSSDHVIEGLSHDSLPILGVQWHPERLCLSFYHNTLSDGYALFTAFLHAFL